jgi:hypothetical protein
VLLARRLRADGKDYRANSVHPPFPKFSAVECPRGLEARSAGGLEPAACEQAVRLVTGRNNQRLFRTAWGILKDRSEAEEAVQDG